MPITTAPSLRMPPRLHLRLRRLTPCSSQARRQVTRRRVVGRPRGRDLRISSHMAAISASFSRVALSKSWRSSTVLRASSCSRLHCATRPRGSIVRTGFSFMASVPLLKNKKARECRAFGVSRYLGGWLDVRGARALGALLDLVLDLVVLLQRLEPCRLDGGK